MSAREEPSRWVFALLGAVAFVLACSASGQVNPLPPEKAFRFTARMLDAQTVEARFVIADGYYLYREKIHFSIEPAAAGLTVARLPDGKIKEDPFFGRVETYRGDLVVSLALKDPKPGQHLVIAAESQGCADIGICYPPTIQRVDLALPAGTVVPGSADGARKSWFN
jgi:thiol:disulfide interchange protein DsbD